MQLNFFEIVAFKCIFDFNIVDLFYKWPGLCVNKTWFNDFECFRAAVQRKISVIVTNEILTEFEFVYKL